MHTTIADGICPPHITPTKTINNAIVLSVRTRKLLGFLLDFCAVSDMVVFIVPSANKTGKSYNNAPACAIPIKQIVSSCMCLCCFTVIKL